MTALALVVFSGAAFAQTVNNFKIDPVFQYLRAMPQNAQSFGAFYQINPTIGFASKTAEPQAKFECIVYTKDAGKLLSEGVFINSIYKDFVTAWVSFDQIDKMATMPEVYYIKAPELCYPNNDVSVGGSGASLLHSGVLNNTAYTGKNVIVAIYDTGIDWDHPDFRDPVDPSKSRILRLWDQTLTAATGEAAPSGFSYGVEYTQAQINDELDGTPANLVREKDTDGHGTHVAGIAAGNGSALPSLKYKGMAPDADLVIIKGGNGSFSESRIIDGLNYLKNLATTLNRPVVLNMSLGGQTGAHDGSRAYEQVVDNFTSSAPGRVVVISAGNDNGKNLHNKLTLGGNATQNVTFTVSDTTGSDVFRYRVYANDNSSISATITAPDGSNVSASSSQSVNTYAFGSSYVIYLYNQVDPNNGDTYVEVYISRNGSNTTKATGVWTLSLQNNTANTLTLDGWLSYINDAVFSVAMSGADNDYVVSSPGNATSAITVASFAGKNNWYSNAANAGYTVSTIRVDSISSFSARGPRRDGVLKPEIAADGQVVASDLSSDASYSSSSVVEVGLYARNSGTSMAAPGVTGAAALLLQANPSATSAQVKTWLTGNTLKDAMTELPGATPNTTWGYGKLDVFKAASAIFNCTPSDRKIYKYDSSTRNGQEGGTTFSTNRVGVKFTPNMTGKLGGVFFHTSLTATGLFAEVRTAGASGTPDSLLGTFNIDSSRVARYSFNYVDLSSLDISVTSGTDFFIILGRTTSSNWSLRYENVSPDGRSYTSSNGGTSWAISANDYKIRAEVYSNKQTSGIIATATSSDTRNINSSSQFINSNCQLISQVDPDGLTPVVGAVTSKVWLENTVPYHEGQPLVTRHYEIVPASGTSTATGRVTLYFTQSEFTLFNGDPGSTKDLPTGPGDADGKANLRVVKYPGSSNDNSGLSGSYSGNATIIDPADGDIVWNESAARWEVSFFVTGFGGFTIQTGSDPLPLFVEYFRGSKNSAFNQLNWKVNCVSTSATFAIERSANGVNFTSIGAINALYPACAQALSYTDRSPLEGANFYRIKVTEVTGVIRYTNIIMLQQGMLISMVYPTVISRGEGIQVRYSGASGTFVLSDVAGRVVYKSKVVNGVQSFDVQLNTAGVYLYRIVGNAGEEANGKIIVQ